MRFLSRTTGGESGRASPYGRPGAGAPGARAWKENRNGSRDRRLGRGRGEALAALLATGGEHLAASRGLHASAKAVRLVAMAVAGTVCALHGSMGLSSAEDRPAPVGSSGHLHAMSRTGVSAKDGGDYGMAEGRVKRRRQGAPCAAATSPANCPIAQLHAGTPARGHQTRVGSRNSPRAIRPSAFAKTSPTAGSPSPSWRGKTTKSAR